MQRSSRQQGTGIIAGAVLVCLPLAGCSVSTTKQDLPKIAPPHDVRPIAVEESIEPLGRIGVVAAPFPATVDYQTPARGGAAGAAIGAAKGLGLGTLCGAGCVLTGGYGQGAALCLVAMGTPYFTVRYAVDQARHGVSGDQMKSNEAAIAAAVEDPNLPEALRDQVLRSASAYGSPSFVLPLDPELGVPTEGDRDRHLASQGIDTVLEIGVERIALQAPNGLPATNDLVSLNADALNPTLTLVVSTRTRLVNATDGTELYAGTRDDRGSARTITEWAVNDAQALREELAQLMQALASETLEQMFDAVPALGAAGVCADEAPQHQHLFSPVDLQALKPPRHPAPNALGHSIWGRA